MMIYTDRDSGQPEQTDMLICYMLVLHKRDLMPNEYTQKRNNFSRCAGQILCSKWLYAKTAYTAKTDELAAKASEDGISGQTYQKKEGGSAHLERGETYYTSRTYFSKLSPPFFRGYTPFSLGYGRIGTLTDGHSGQRGGMDGWQIGR